MLTICAIIGTCDSYIQFKNLFCMSNMPKKNMAGIEATMYLCAYILVSGSCFSLSKIVSDQIKIIARGMKAIDVNILARFRYCPHRFKFPKPKA